MMRPAAALAAVVAVLGAGTVAATVVSPGDAGPAPVSREVPVTTTSFACPRVGETGETRLNAVATNVETSGLISPVLVRPLDDPKGEPQALVAKPDTAKSLMGSGHDGAWRVDVRGPLAAGVAADQLSRVLAGPLRGLSSASCTAPSTDTWFAGFATDVGQHSHLLLTNLDDVPAVVQIDIWGPGGEVGGRGSVGVTVDPHKQSTLQLDEIAPGLSAGAIHVTTSAGRVASAVAYDAQDGSLPLGIDWVPATQGPARNLVIPGLVGGAGPRSLLLAVPGEEDADVTVKVVRPDGSFAPEGAPPVTVTAGTVESVDLSSALEGQPGALVVTSTEPVVAAAVASIPGTDGTADIAFSAAALPLSAPAGVPGNLGGGTRHTQLLLTAPDEDATVTIRALSRDGSEGVSKRVQVPAGTTQPVDVAGMTKDDHAGLIVVPDKGSVVYGARVLVEQDPGGAWTLVTGGPLVSVTSVRTVHAASPSLEIGLPQ